VEDRKVKTRTLENHEGAAPGSPANHKLQCNLCVGYELSPMCRVAQPSGSPKCKYRRAMRRLQPQKLLVVSCRGKWHRLLAGNHAVFPGSTEPEVRVRVPRKNMKGSHKPSKNRDRYHSELLLRLELESNPEALSLVRATLERAAESMHFPEADLRAIVRSVDEAVANVIRHAYKGRPGLPITLSCHKLWCKDANLMGGLEILLEDSGEPADPQKLQGRPLEEVRPGGLGLHFMRQSMDEVEFSRKNDKNLLRMVKYLEPARPETGEKENRPCR
jgi:serine/threonine-protein kinase RsbW